MTKSSVTKGAIKFWTFTALTIIVSVFDNIFTYVGSPDLSREANPLVYTLGFNWVGLIISNVILLCIFIISYYYSFIKFKPDVIPCKGFKEYFSMLYFDRPDKFIWTLYKMPKNKRVYSYIIACCGYVMAILVPIIRLRAVTEWALFLSNKDLFYSYCMLIEKISFTTLFGRFDYFLMILVIIILLIIYWFFQEYKINKIALEEQKNDLSI